MHDKQNSHNPALVELRRRLADGLARSPLNQTTLARQAKLGRTTVSEALSSSKPVPSAVTVAAMARVLQLPVQDLLDLQRTAAEKSDTVTTNRPGRPIGQWDPHDLEVHPAGTAQDGSGLPEQRLLPSYVGREHDRILGEAVEEVRQGHSRMLVLVGGSSTGKTRACWEAVQPLADSEWWLWHPFDPTGAEAALEDLHRVGPRTVVWLNEAQHYFGDRAVGKRIAAAVHRLLTSPQRGPVLVLGTLWDDYFRQYTALPAAFGQDPYSRVRELLAGRTVIVPNAFDTQALAAATALAESGDRLLADALTRARTDGRLTQDLAGAPVLLERYLGGSPAAKALLEVAMDARRLGVGLHLAQAFLTDAVADYLDDPDWDQLSLTEDWAEKAYAELAEPVHGKQTPLRRVTPRPQRRPPAPSTPTDAPSSRPLGPVFRLADYLDQYGRSARRRLCPPASFWDAAYSHLTHPDELNNLTKAAEERHRLQWAHHLRQRAADHGSANAKYRLALMAGDSERAETLAREGADDFIRIPGFLPMAKDAWEPADAGSLPWEAVNRSPDEASQAVSALEEAEYRESAETLARLAAAHGSTYALELLALMREEAGDRESAETLARQAAAHGNTYASLRLAGDRELAGNREGAETMYRLAIDYGDTRAVSWLAEMFGRAEDWEKAELLAWQAADQGDTYALSHLAWMREDAGDRQSAESLARQAADRGHNDRLHGMSSRRLFKKLWPYGLEPDGTPTPRWQ